MHKWTDAVGREWEIDVDTTTVVDVNKRFGVLLPALFDDDYALMIKLQRDFEVLRDVLHAVSKGPETTIEEFGRGLKGDASAAAREALYLEIADFFEFPEQRSGARAMLTMFRDTTTKMAQEATEEIAKIDTTQTARSALDYYLNWRESSASNRGDLHLAN